MTMLKELLNAKFPRFLAPEVISIAYILAVAIQIMVGLFKMALQVKGWIDKEGWVADPKTEITSFLLTPVLTLCVILFTRVCCEVALVVFRIEEHLRRDRREV